MNILTKKIILTSLILIFTICSLPSLGGVEEPSLLNHKQWRILQIHEARQQLLEAQKKFKIQNSPQSRVQLKTMRSRLKYAENLTEEDYFLVYLSQYSENDKSLFEVSKILSVQSIKYLIKAHIQKNPSPKPTPRKALNSLKFISKGSSQQRQR